MIIAGLSDIDGSDIDGSDMDGFGVNGSFINVFGVNGSFIDGFGVDGSFIDRFGMDVGRTELRLASGGRNVAACIGMILGGCMISGSALTASWDTSRTNIDSFWDV